MNSSASTPSLLEKKPYILAILITVILIVWMSSGMLFAESELDSTTSVKKKEEHHKKLPSVQITQFQSQDIQRSLELYGRTEPDRVVQLSAEVDGRVSKIFVNEGQVVKAGDKLVQLALEDKLAQLNYAKTLVKQRTIEFQGAQSLQAKGLQGESLLAQAEAALVEAQALVTLRETQVTKSTITAPFDGVLENQNIEIGSYVNKGQSLFDVVDLEPLVVRAYITENHVDSIKSDAEVNVKLVTGKTVKGKIRFISSISEVGTNTFPIEVEVANPEQKMKAGVSTEIDLMFAKESAIKVTPALLSLDKDGNLGVKTVIDDIVVFTPIDLIKAEQDGVWLGGFNGDTQVITRGQGFVRPGDKVITSLAITPSITSTTKDLEQ